MGLRLKKSVRVGPFRFNLSNSGIGVSAGIKGLRVGSGPRGNYIHMGRDGLYYRQTFSQSKNNPKPITDTSRHDASPNFDYQTPDGTHETLQEIESGDIASMVDTSSESLVQELNQKRKKIRFWPWVLVLGLGFTGYLATKELPNWLISIVGLLSLLGLASAAYRDVMSKSVVILYDIEDEFQDIYQSLHIAFEQMAKCKSKWHMESEGRVLDSKYHAGADNLVKRNAISLSLSNPPFVKTNVATPAIPVGKQTLYFFPDMVLVFEPSGVGAVSYEHLEIDVSSQNFIEDEAVPRDAKVIDHTWRYVNKSGGPDKRFKDNRKLPIVLYEDVHLTSPTGLNERIELSKVGVAKLFAKAIQDVGNTNKKYG